MADNRIAIIGTSPTGHTDLVVVVKLGGGLDGATERLRKYMAGVGAEAGLVVGPDVIRILRQTYQGDPSIQVVDEFPIALAHGLRIGTDVVEFEDSVQRWLEAFQEGRDVAAEPLRSALAEHVLPLIEGGAVRAAGPRVHAAAS